MTTTMMIVGMSLLLFGTEITVWIKECRIVLSDTFRRRRRSAAMDTCTGPSPRSRT